ncbi:MAG: cobalamin B12-binding domain-containing protein [Pirellulaceae bacterium]
MTKLSDPMAATLLSVSASAYAAYASNRLLEKMPAAKLQLGDAAFNHWKDHLGQRLEELSAAISEESIELFVSQVRWSRAAFAARQVPDEMLRESLACLAETLDEELPEANRDVPGQYLAAAVESFEEDRPVHLDLEATNEVSRLALSYLERALEADTRQAIQIMLDARDGGIPLEEVYRALMTAQGEIGSMWHKAEVSIAEEHLVTSTTKQVLSILSFQAERQPANGLTVLSAAVAGNTHDLGVRVVSDFFEMAGWRTVCLGGNLPPQEIAQAVATFSASLALLSAAISTQLQALRETVQAIRQLGQPCKIIVGGSALSAAPELWKQTGADAYARSPREALDTGLQLVQSGNNA